ncbi:MAG: YgdI/YgdR family lipoprotein, partial [Planctomycetaceae bacterium]|nr:YgdI/YgdR family lipoprotein [Planctomycetaceae bacterium]
MKLLTLVFTLFYVLVLSGCSSDNVWVTGNVTFEDDGQPIEHGAINFQNETKIYTGTIRNGKYKSGGIKSAQAIQPGQYKVWFSNV